MAVLTLPASVAAKPGYYVTSPGVSLGFAVHGSHGYAIEVVGGGRQLEIRVWRGLGTGSATYRLPGRARHGVIRANLGILGRIDLRFDARSIEHLDGIDGCRGKSTREEKGVFEGTVRIRGEGGYTRFSAERVRGYVAHRFRRVCKRPASLLPGADESRPDPATKGNDPAEPDLYRLGAAMSERNRSVYLVFAGIEKPRRLGAPRVPAIGAMVGVRERRGRISIERSSTVIGRGVLSLGPEGARPAATLNLPAPFAGRAHYGVDAEGRRTWAGSLRVRLPGAGTVPLAGPGFVAALCHGDTLEETRDCGGSVAGEIRRGPD